MMHKTESVSKRSANRRCHLKLVGVDHRQLTPDLAAPADASLPIPTEIRQLTHAMMNRLWIPDTNTIVGLLDVGLSHTNFEELSKWLAHQVDAASQQDIASLLPRLEKRFRATFDQFPEL